MKNEAVTIYDVAEAAGISIATVSRVLNRPEMVSESTRNSVFSVMEELGFTPRAEARDRARKHVGRIGVITPYFTHPSFVHRLRGISELLRGEAFEMVILNLESEEQMENYLRQPGLEHRIDGLIFLSQKLTRIASAILKERRLPSVFVEFGEDDFSSIRIDNYKGGSLAARFLLEKGYRSFGVLTEEEEEIKVHPNRLRVSGFLDYLTEQGLNPGDDSIVYCPLGLEEAVNQAEKFLERTVPSAIFATTDFLAVAVIKAAKKKGISIPGEMGLIGFDGTNTSEYLDLTTVDQSLEESGRLAAEILLEELSTPRVPVKTVYLDLKIIERETTTS